MSQRTSIGWTDATWSPVTGCTRVSEGCRNCYAERLTATRLRQNSRFAGLADMTASGPRWTNGVRCSEGELTKPLHWKQPRRIFVNSMSDTFHEQVPFEFVDKIFAVMALCPQHTFQVLTKRPERMAEYLSGQSLPGQCWASRQNAIVEAARKAFPGRWKLLFEFFCSEFSWPLPNVWVGTSVEDQKAADSRIPHLLDCPAAVRFLSCEPLLGPLDIEWCLDWDRDNHCKCGDGECQECWALPSAPIVDWVILGGESGPGARSMTIGWAKEIIRQCQVAGVPAFVKQLGSKPVNREGVRHAVTDSHGENIEEFPEVLRVRQFPGVR